ncbi:related to ariadne-2 protein [Cephalotrichum gorgonifer]|uniref:RBR-type E3 ubiquitin transferase n=1 Tax=Cephalotrichum gorgonifer TaxID=2041049 RepID=A0AAE8STQ8_9PEZI|nr:related to ariadne-2 protein [Cephalotrichum gorgonifer]
MASAAVLPCPALATNDNSNSCPAIVASGDVDYLVDVLRLDNGKSESDLDDEVAAKASALGIDVSVTRVAPTAGQGPTSSVTNSPVSFPTCGTRSLAPSSQATTIRSLTAPSLVPDVSPSTSSTKLASEPRRRSDTLGFSVYDRYLAQLGPNITQPKLVKSLSTTNAGEKNQTLFGLPTTSTLANFKNGFKTRMLWGKKHFTKSDTVTSCICCRDEFDQSSALHNLPCGHTYCCECLRVMIDQAITDETKMPPRCCTLPVPSTILSGLLDSDERLLFIKAVVQFSTPWELRVFCPKAACGEFIPPRHKVDPKHPFVVVCKKCDTSVCSMCKRGAHEIGRDCPDDWDLDAVLKIGEKSGWRRCYRCRTLVELVQGCTHMTCRCKAQFCYICGAIWDPAVGCPNFCNGEEEMERRRAQEEARLAEREAAEEAEATERREAERRTVESPEFDQLREAQAAELKRFAAYARRNRDVMWAGQLRRKLSLADKHSDQMEKMRERHAKTVAHLEDRQIKAEMDLRETLEASERSVQIRLKHMEAYCNGISAQAGSGGGDAAAAMPQRTVTERDLRELSQQYTLRDGMERMHNSRINVMRDRQLKAAEELVERQEAEWLRLETKRDEETEALAVEFSLEEEALSRELEERGRRLRWRWVLCIEILRRKLEEQHGVAYAGIPPPQWPGEEDRPGGGMEPVLVAKGL